MAKIDERYKRGKIYTVRCKYDDSLIYVGSTIEKLSIRMAKHRYDKTCSLYKYVDGDWKNWYIELYEEYPCNNKQILEKREGEMIREIGNINNVIAGRTQKEYRQDNKEKIAEQRKEYREANGDKINEKKKEHYQVNREKINEKKKEHYQVNSEIILEKNKEYRQANKEKIAEQKKEIIKCDICDCEISRRNLIRHQKSKKCINYNITNK